MKFVYLYYILMSLIWKSIQFFLFFVKVRKIVLLVQCEGILPSHFGREKGENKRGWVRSL